MMIRRLFLPLLLLLAWFGNALAAGSPPAPDANAAEWARLLYQAAVAGEWKIASGLALLGVVFALRTWGIKLIPWLETKAGGLALAFTVSIASTIGLALAAGASISPATIAAALGTAATAAGLWQWLQNMLKPKAGA